MTDDEAKAMTASLVQLNLGHGFTGQEIEDWLRRIGASDASLAHVREILRRVMSLTMSLSRACGNATVCKSTMKNG